MFFGLFTKKEPEYEVKMRYDKTQSVTKRNIINFLRSLEIEVKTNTKARGNNGFYRKNRIDVARDLEEEKAVEVLVHEFAHYIHSKIDKDFNKNGGSLETLFNTNDVSDIKTELKSVTNIIDKNKRLDYFVNAKHETADKIKNIQKSIQNEYPNFMRSKNFVEFDKYIKNSDAKYLIKHDAVKIRSGWFFKQERILSIQNIEKDFPDMPKAFVNYIKLCSMQRKQAKISRRINQMNKYFNKPTELFARFVQGYFFNVETTKRLAPLAAERFSFLLKRGYYKELKDFFEIFEV